MVLPLTKILVECNRFCAKWVGDIVPRDGIMLVMELCCL